MKKEYLSLPSHSQSSMGDIAEIIGGKWKLVILQILIFKGTQRFSCLLKNIDGISQSMLTKQLRTLERDGMVSRRVYAEVPPRVEYSPTEQALRLKNVFIAMLDWWAKGHR